MGNIIAGFFRHQWTRWSNPYGNYIVYTCDHCRSEVGGKQGAPPALGCKPWEKNQHTGR